MKKFKKHFQGEQADVTVKQASQRGIPPCQTFLWTYICYLGKKEKQSSTLYSALPLFHPLLGKIKVTGVARSKDTHLSNFPKALQNTENHALAAVTYQNVSTAYM